MLRIDLRINPIRHRTALLNQLKPRNLYVRSLQLSGSRVLPLTEVITLEVLEGVISNLNIRFVNEEG